MADRTALKTPTRNGREPSSPGFLTTVFDHKKKYYINYSRVFKNTEFYGGGKTSENSLNEPAELSLRCLAKTENDHCAAPCDTGVGDEGVLLKDRKPDDAIQRQGLVGLRPGRPREGPPCPTRSQSVLRHPPLAWGAALYAAAPRRGMHSPPG